MISNANNGKGAQVALIAILLAGLVPRLIYLSMNSGAPDFDSPILDPQLNDYWARALVTGNWTPPPHADDPEIRATPYGRPPGYPYLLAAIYWMGNGSYLAPRIVQVLIGLANIALLFALTRALFNTRTAAAASLLLAFYWSAVYFEGELNSPVWEVFLALVMIHLLLRWNTKDSRLSLALAGATLGVAALMRPNVLLIGVFMVLWIVCAARKRREHWVNAAGYSSLFLAVCVITIMPALTRNYVVAREFVLISYYGGVNAYIGNNPEAEGVSPTVPDLYEISGLDKWNCFTYPKMVRGMARHLDAPDLGYADASRYFYGRALSFWRNAPGQALTLTLRKAWLFWCPHEISDSKVIHYERKTSLLLARLPGFPLILALALLGLACVLYRTIPATNDVAPAGIPLVLLYIAAYFLSILPFFIAGRYRFPAVPLLLPFAGVALVELTSMLHNKRPGRALAFTAAGAVLYAAVSWPIMPYTPNRSTWHTHRGIAHAARARLAPAAAELQQAIAADARNDEAWLHLGYLRARQERDDEALEYYENAVAANPHNIYAQNNLGYAHFQRGDYDSAEQHYRRALARAPEYSLALNNLGNTLLEQGRVEEAIAQFERALAISPNDPHARYNMGNVFLRTARYDEATEHYLAAFEENPHNPDIANNLGLALARTGELRESVIWFEEALALHPNHFLAHFNLGNVYGDLGLYEEARSHFEQCLTLHPDHEETQARMALLDALQEGERGDHGASDEQDSQDTDRAHNGVEPAAVIQ